LKSLLDSGHFNLKNIKEMDYLQYFLLFDAKFSQAG
jgi:hypothetical protein